MRYEYQLNHFYQFKRHNKVIKFKIKLKLKIHQSSTAQLKIQLQQVGAFMSCQQLSDFIYGPHAFPLILFLEVLVGPCLPLGSFNQGGPYFSSCVRFGGQTRQTLQYGQCYMYTGSYMFVTCVHFSHKRGAHRSV